MNESITSSSDTPITDVSENYDVYGFDYDADNDTGSHHRQIVAILNRYFKPTIMGVGLIGNVITAIYLLSCKTLLRRCAVGHLLAAVCVSNAVFLAAGLPMWAAQEFGARSNADWYNRDGACEFLSLATMTSNFLSTWYTVSLGVERFISVARWWSRHKATRLTATHISSSTANEGLTRRSRQPAAVCETFTVRSLVIAVGVFAVCIFLNISVNWGVNHNPNRPTICLPLPVASNALRVLDNIDFLVNILLPYVVVIVLYSVTFFRLVALRLRFRLPEVVQTRSIGARRSEDGAAITTAELSGTSSLNAFEMRLLGLSASLTVVSFSLQLPSQSIRAVHLIIDAFRLSPIFDGSEILLFNLVHVLFCASFAAPFFVIFGDCLFVHRRHDDAATDDDNV